MALGSLGRATTALLFALILLGFGLYIALMWDPVAEDALMLALAIPRDRGRPRAGSRARTRESP